MDHHWPQIGDEVLGHLGALLRLDTRNPPGNEILAATYLRDVLAKEGIDSEIVGPSPDRATIVARIKGDGSARPLLLMSHTDVVAVEPDKWNHPPFAAEIADGYLYGRGAIDMKNMVAMELQTLLTLKRRKVRLKRDVIFMAAADEEVGGRAGAGWVVDHRPDLIEAEYALNEGGGTAREVNGKLYYTVQTAEKGVMRFILRTRGRPGHGAYPHDDHAVIKLAEKLARMRNNRLPIHLTPTVKSFISTIAQDQPDPLRSQLMALLDPSQTDAAIDALQLDDFFKHGLRIIVRNTLSPTILQAGTQINVIPSIAEARIDGRVLPGTTRESFLAELKQLFGDDAEIEFLMPPGTLPALESEPAGPMLQTIVEVLAERAPGCRVVPRMLPGATDAKHVSRLGTRVYGFAPDLYTVAGEGNRVHGHDERVAVESIKWGARVLYEVVEKFCT